MLPANTIALCSDVNWGSSTQGATYVNALKHVHDLQYVEEHVKNYRPQILVLTGSPMSRQPLLDFATLFSKNTAFLACGQIAKVCNSARIIGVCITRANCGCLGDQRYGQTLYSAELQRVFHNNYQFVLPSVFCPALFRIRHCLLLPCSG